jgi:hypothetical protein
MNSGSLPGREPRRTKHLPLSKCYLYSPRTPRPWVSGGKVRHGGGLRRFDEIETWRLSRPSRSNRPSKLGHRSPAVYDSHGNPGAFQPFNMPCLIINSIYLLISCRPEGLVDSSCWIPRHALGASSPPASSSDVPAVRPSLGRMMCQEPASRQPTRLGCVGVGWQMAVLCSNGVEVAVAVAHAVRSSSGGQCHSRDPNGNV